MLPELMLPRLPIAGGFGDSRAALVNERQVMGVDVDQFTTAPLRQHKQVTLNAPVETVFRYVGDHEAMTDWIPLMHRVTVDHSHSNNGPHLCGVGSIRTCELGPDKISERIVVWEPDQMFAYRVIDGQKGVPIDGGFGLVTFEPIGARHTLMNYRVYYEPKKWNPKATMMPVMVSLQINGGMKNLVKHFGGEVVKK